MWSGAPWVLLLALPLVQGQSSTTMHGDHGGWADGLQVSNVTRSGATFHWTAHCSSQDIAVRSWVAYHPVAEDEAGEPIQDQATWNRSEAQEGAGRQQVTVTGLQPGREHYAHARAGCGALGGSSKTLCFRTDPDMPDCSGLLVDSPLDRLHEDGESKGSPAVGFLAILLAVAAAARLRVQGPGRSRGPTFQPVA